jgi:Alpha 1,4-glycosyltransferase conserved region
LHRELSKNFNPSTWGGNGGFMLTSSVRAFCNNSDIPDHIENLCGNFTTFSSVKCYPYNYGGWKKIFQEDAKNEVFERLKNTGAFFFHIWNKMQDFDKTHYELMANSTSAYIQLAKIHCPNTYAAIVKSGSFF